MTEVRVVTHEQINFAELESLHRESFKELIEQRGADLSAFSQEYFRWKYENPFGKGRVALIYEGHTIIAMNSMIPLKLRWKDNSFLSWQSGDTATSPASRGKGCFGKCIRALKESLGAGEIFWGYPNHNSMPGFIKLGWTEQDIVTTWMSPFPGLSAIGPKLQELSKEEFINRKEEIEHWLDDPNKYERPSLVKNWDYFLWRYFDHPTVKYTCLYITNQGDWGGDFVFVRSALVMNRKVTVIMDVVSSGFPGETKLLRAARKWSSANGLWPTILLSNAVSWKAGLAAGFVPIPSRFLPKKQSLMGAGTSPEAQEAFLARWAAQTGDWDAF